jgi:hypothetical protein
MVHPRVRRPDQVEHGLPQGCPMGFVVSRDTWAFAR